jgi:1,4-dihydroxy-2-naphthoate octaprenyltransferase
MCNLHHAAAALGAVVALGRPLFMVGAWVFYALGVTVVYLEGVTLDWRLALLGLLTMSAIQLVNHYSNDYFDRDTDALNTTATRWTGGSRVLPKGELPPRVAWRATQWCALFSLVLSLITAVFSPVPLAAIAWFAAALALAYYYSAPPLWLNRRGLGEISGAFIIPGMTALTGYFLQAGSSGQLIWLVIAPLCLLQFAMLLAVSIPDAEADERVGKRTLAVRFGRCIAAYLFVVTLALTYLLLPLLVLAGLPLVLAAALYLCLPLAFWLAQVTLRGYARPESWEALTFWSIGLLVGSALLMLITLVWLGQL